MKKLGYIIIILFTGLLHSQITPKFNTYRTLDSLHSIEISSNITVKLIPTKVVGIQLRGKQTAKDFISFSHTKGKLHIFTTQDVQLPTDVEVTIFAPSVKHIRLKNEAILQAEDAFTTDSLTIHSSRSSYYNLKANTKYLNVLMTTTAQGDLKAVSDVAIFDIKGSAIASVQLDTKEIRASLSDFGVLDIEGTYNTAFFNLIKEGKLQGRKFKGDNCNIDSQSSFGLHINAKEKVSVNVKSKSEITIHGNPKKIDTLALHKKAKIIRQ